ncbi:hypothetical protein EOE18_13265 [Novosphingobium umbonatum]|uniref:Uncharacterized protein n=1 Tax=Novosphingobium umbonatum TaxID=1908524 RepID=A0A3S2UQ80_9SPHN|nr:hypothetical protein [Novosphingobium umbonatum]RVU04131.1 hypothetical protein EOE18_13265 [Novosphingobium umbonatum]
MFDPVSVMFHCGGCHFCGEQGSLGFYLCNDQQTLIILCDECNTVYTAPEKIEQGIYSYLGSPPDYLIEGLDVSVVGGRDATRDEIKAAGWLHYIQGRLAYNGRRLWSTAAF